ncbi:MAG: hypothetical protein AB9869_21620 [Verrucomicrobiia bacterium]
MNGQLSINLTASTFNLPAGDSETDPITLTLNNAGSALKVGSLEFYVQTDALGPKIASVDLVSGTIWDGVGNTVSAIGSNNGPHWQAWGVSKTASGVGTGPEIPPGGSFIATLTFDTVGVAPGTYAFKLVGTTFDGGVTILDSKYVADTLGGEDLPINVTNGNLTVVPEPNATLAVAGLLLGVAALARRWRAAR